MWTWNKVKRALSNLPKALPFTLKGGGTPRPSSTRGLTSSLSVGARIYLGGKGNGDRAGPGHGVLNLVSWGGELKKSGFLLGEGCHRRGELSVNETREKGGSR